MAKKYRYAAITAQVVPAWIGRADANFSSTVEGDAAGRSTPTWRSSTPAPAEEAAPGPRPASETRGKGSA